MSSFPLGEQSEAEDEPRRFPSGSATNAILSPGSGVSQGVQTGADARLHRTRVGGVEVIDFPGCVGDTGA